MRCLVNAPRRAAQRRSQEQQRTSCVISIRAVRKLLRWSAQEREQNSGEDQAKYFQTDLGGLAQQVVEQQDIGIRVRLMLSAGTVPCMSVGVQPAIGKMKAGSRFLSVKAKVYVCASQASHENHDAQHEYVRYRWSGVQVA